MFKSKPGACALALMVASVAAAQEPVMVDPEDFTRTPCEFRETGCDEEQPAYTTLSSEYETLESDKLVVQLDSGVSLDVTVSLVNAETGGKRVLAKYEALQAEFLDEATRSVVFAELAPAADAYQVDRAWVAACRPTDEVCFWSTFDRDVDGEWLLRDGG